MQNTTHSSNRAYSEKKTIEKNIYLDNNKILIDVKKV